MSSRKGLVILIAAALFGATACGGATDGTASSTSAIGATDPIEAAHVTVTVCGNVEAYVPAEPTSDGSITIENRTYAIAAGTTVSGDPTRLLPASDLCVFVKIGPDGKVAHLEVVD